MFSLQLLPASDGDCLLLRWGTERDMFHLVVDGGRTSTYPALRERLTELAAVGSIFTLYVLTHIDSDHIEGALSFLKDDARPSVPMEVWYNGRREMTVGTGSVGSRSMAQGDAYSTLIGELGWPVNREFADGVAKVESARQPLRIFGLTLTLLSPDTAHLTALGSRWEDWRRENELRKRVAKPIPLRPIPHPIVLEDLIMAGAVDREGANGTSIAFVAEWEGRRVLLSGDAHPDLLASSLKPLALNEGGRYRVDLLKGPHHGSAKNLTQTLVELLDCKRLAISTNGRLHGHPDPESIARFLHYGSPGTRELYFNYNTARTAPWADPDTMRRYGYQCHFPGGQDGTLEIQI